MNALKSINFFPFPKKAFLLPSRTLLFTGFANKNQALLSLIIQKFLDLTEVVVIFYKSCKNGAARPYDIE